MSIYQRVSRWKKNTSVLCCLSFVRLFCVTDLCLLAFTPLGFLYYFPFPPCITSRIVFPFDCAGDFLFRRAIDLFHGDG